MTYNVFGGTLNLAQPNTYLLTTCYAALWVQLFVIVP